MSTNGGWTRWATSSPSSVAPAQFDLRVLVDAHMDEVGLMVIEVDSSGMLKFEGVGGFDDRALLGKVVQVGPKKITGVIGARPIHLLKSGQYTAVVKRDAMRIDIGAKNKKPRKAKSK